MSPQGKSYEVNFNIGVKIEFGPFSWEGKMCRYIARIFSARGQGDFLFWCSFIISSSKLKPQFVVPNKKAESRDSAETVPGAGVEPAQALLPTGF